MNIGILKKALWLVNALLLAGVVLASVKTFSRTASANPSSGSGDAQPIAPLASSARLTPEEVASITKTGVIVPVSVTSQPVVSPARTTSQDVQVETNFSHKLIGTSIFAEAALAVFVGPNGQQTVHRVGDKVGDAVVVAVEPSSVTLERAGEKFIVNLELRKVGEYAAAGPPAQRTPYIPSRPDLAPPLPGAQESAEAQPESGEEPSAGEEEEWQEDYDQMVIPLETAKEYLINMGKYINELVVLSHYDAEGNLDGLILGRVPPASEAYKRGLREGDIITSIQDVPLTDTSVVSKVGWDILEHEDYLVNVVVMRNGEEEILTYEIWPEE